MNYGMQRTSLYKYCFHTPSSPSSSKHRLPPNLTTKIDPSPITTNQPYQTSPTKMSGKPVPPPPKCPRCGNELPCSCDGVPDGAYDASSFKAKAIASITLKNIAIVSTIPNDARGICPRCFWWTGICRCTQSCDNPPEICSKCGKAQSDCDCARICPNCGLLADACRCEIARSSESRTEYDKPVVSTMPNDPPETCPRSDEGTADCDRSNVCPDCGQKLPCGCHP